MRLRYGAVDMGAADIVELTTESSAPATYDALEIGTIEATVKAPPGTLSIVDGQPLELYDDDLRVGTYYLTQLTRTGTAKSVMLEHSITAEDGLSLLEQSRHYGGLYTGQLAVDIIADIVNIPHHVKSLYNDVAVYGWLPIDTRRNNLLQVLFAIGAGVVFDADGFLRVQPLWGGLAGDIPDSRIYAGDVEVDTAAVSDIEVVESQFVPLDSVTTLFEGDTAEGEPIVFDAPMHSLTATGFQILSSGANYAYVTPGIQGVLSGSPYRQDKRVIVRHIADLDVPSEVVVDTNTLVSIVNSNDIADRLASYYKATKTIENRMLRNGEMTGNLVGFSHPWDGEAVEGLIIQSTDEYSRANVASSRQSVVGYIPPSFGMTDVSSERIVLTDDGTFIVPEGVNTLRVALIGSGQDGTDGQAGTDGTRAANSTGSGITATASSNSPSPSNGLGGDGGIAGQGGNVYVIDVEVTPGQEIAYIGGATTAETTFGAYSSADGERVETGYTDPVTGDTFARPGVDGTPGGDGGETSDGTGDGGGTSSGGSGYPAASHNIPTVSRYQRSYNHSVVGGGGGGGDSHDTPGADGQDARDSAATLDDERYYIYLYQPGNGGDGANAATTSAYGAGGDGGGGGGGGGRGGSGSCTMTDSWGTDTCSARFYTSWTRANDGTTVPDIGGFGGAGGKGAAGHRGAIVVYFSRPSVLSDSGRFVVTESQTMVDKHGRKVIV